MVRRGSGKLDSERNKLCCEEATHKLFLIIGADVRRHAAGNDAMVHEEIGGMCGRRYVYQHCLRWLEVSIRNNKEALNVLNSFGIRADMNHSDKLE